MSIGEQRSMVTAIISSSFRIFSSSCTTGLKRSTCPTIKIFPSVRYLSHTISASSWLRDSGFSINRWRLWSAAKRARSLWRKDGAATTQASTSDISSSAESNILPVYPVFNTCSLSESKTPRNSKSSFISVSSLTWFFPMFPTPMTPILILLMSDTFLIY